MPFGRPKKYPSKKYVTFEGTLRGTTLKWYWRIDKKSNPSKPKTI
jgi:hypothetical protein